MNREEVEDLIRKNMRGIVRVHRFEEQHGDDIGFLSYSSDDQNQLTIWHTEVPAAIQHLGIGGRLVEQALKLAESQASKVRIVCPFAKDYLARHPELKEKNAAANGAVLVADALVAQT